MLYMYYYAISMGSYVETIRLGELRLLSFVTLAKPADTTMLRLGNRDWYITTIFINS